MWTDYVFHPIDTIFGGAPEATYPVTAPASSGPSFSERIAEGVGGFVGGTGAALIKPLFPYLLIFGAVMVVTFSLSKRI